MKFKVGLVLLTLFSLVSCGNEDKGNTPSSSFHYEYTDVSGYKTTINKKPERVAILFSSYTQIWVSVGGKVSVTVGDSIKRGFVNKEDVVLVNDSSGMKIDQELLIASNPDLIIGTYDLSSQVNAINFCRQEKINGILLKEDSFDDYLKILKLFSDLNENKTSYNILGEQVKERIEVIKNKVRGQSKKYLFIRGGTAFNLTEMKTKNTHFGCEIFDELGAKNICDDLHLISEQLSLEQILLNEPDIIVIVPKGEEKDSKSFIESLFKLDGWKDLKAVQNNKYYFLDKELFGYKPNNNWDKSYLEAYNIIYEK